MTSDVIVRPYAKAHHVRVNSELVYGFLSEDALRMMQDRFYTPVWKNVQVTLPEKHWYVRAAEDLTFGVGRNMPSVPGKPGNVWVDLRFSLEPHQRVMLQICSTAVRFQDGADCVIYPSLFDSFIELWSSGASQSTVPALAPLFVVSLVVENYELKLAE